MTTKTVSEERSYESELRNALSLYMLIMLNWCRIVETYFPMINSIMLDNIGKHISAATPLTRIALLQVLISVIFYNPHLEFSEQENMDVMQQFFVHFTKECENMEIWLPQKWTVMGLTSILLLPTSYLTTSIYLAYQKGWRGLYGCIEQSHRQWDDSQFLVGEDWDKDLDKDDKYHTISLMDLKSSYYLATPLVLHFRASQRCTIRYRPWYPPRKWKYLLISN